MLTSTNKEKKNMDEKRSQVMLFEINKTKKKLKMVFLKYVQIATKTCIFKLKARSLEFEQIACVTTLPRLLIISFWEQNSSFGGILKQQKITVKISAYFPNQKFVSIFSLICLAKIYKYQYLHSHQFWYFILQFFFPSNFLFLFVPFLLPLMMKIDEWWEGDMEIPT